MACTAADEVVYALPLGCGAMSKNTALVVVAAVAGVALIALGIYYWVEPAGSLPSWLPGYTAGSGHHHVKHGIAAFLVGVACLVFAWFRSAPKKKEPEQA
jgi:hypothetical protein